MCDRHLKGAFEPECRPWKTEAGATLSVGSLAFSVVAERLLVFGNVLGGGYR